MAGDNNPIRYSDLVVDDGAIKEAINQLTLLRDAYKSIIDQIKTYAREVDVTMKHASGATEEGRQATRKAADETSRLEKAQRELAFAQSEVGAKVAELRMLIAEQNKESRTSATIANAGSQGYKQLQAEVEKLVTAYKKLSHEEAMNSAQGQQMLTQIVNLKKYLSDWDRMLKVKTQTTNQSTAADKLAAQMASQLEKERAKLAAATSAENMTLLNLMAEQKEANQIAKLNSIIAREQEGSYNRLSAQYALNKIQLNKMSQAERETTEAGKQLVNETNQIYASMNRLQEAVGNHTLNVGNYKRSWDGLNMGVSQIVRELPAAAVSLNTFFLGISNNIPILIDEINKARAANQALAASGEKTVSVFKRLAKAMFGWNTIIMLVLTFLSMYGKQIIDFIRGTDKAAESVYKLTIAEQYLLEARNSAAKEGQKELIRLKLLYAATQNVNLPMEKRIKAVKELKRLYPEYLKHISDEGILAGRASNSYLILASSILKAARSRAYEDKIVENESKIIDMKDKQLGQQVLIVQKQKEIDRMQKTLDDAKKGGLAGSFIGTYENELKRLNLEKDALIERKKSIEADIEAAENANKRLASNIDVTDIIDDQKPDKKPKGPKDRTEEIEAANLAIRKKYAESVTALERDELVKQANQLQDTYDAETASLMNKYYNDKDLTQESRDLIAKIVYNWAVKLGRDTEDIMNLITQRQLEKEVEMWQLKLDATKEGSVEELAVRLNMMEVQRQQEIIANRMLIEEKRQDEALINKKWDAIIENERNKSLYDIAMENLRIQQEYTQSEFDLLKTTENEKTRFKLKAERERWAKILQMAKAGMIDMTDLEIKTVENYIKKIDQMLGEIPMDLDIWDLLGLDLSGEQKEALNTAINETISNLQEVINKEIEMADIAIKKAQERVDAKQKALDDEIEARNNGYAFNVSAAQRELDAEKKNLEKAQKEKQKYVLVQQRLDTVVQTSSLITASANIWSSFSSMGPIGTILAAAAIAAMFGSFIWAKTKASQATKAQTYGEGGFEILNGGSHQSGNDVPIGYMSDGRERRAEGGEGLAIIRKNRMNKYKRLVPDVIDSFNKGTFESKYLKAFNTDNINIGLAHSNVDLKQIEGDLREIKEQGQTRIIVDGTGRQIRYYKNLKTVYKT